MNKLNQMLLLAGAALTLSLGTGNLIAQDQPPQRQGRGNFDPEQARQRMMDRYKERVFHVQTEDKGVNNPFIESVVYFGGQVMAAKRATYSDLLQEGRGNEAIASRMDNQHRLMIAAIRSGKLDGKLRDVLGPEPVSDEPRIADGRSAVA
ncbi:MAG: hypothetical protein ABI651_11900, partial [Verrucomicrobiota bacterium]